MTVAELEKRVRNRLRDITGTDSERLWSSEELIDDIANGVRYDLFRIVKWFLIDSVTAADNEGLPLAVLPIIANQSLYALSPKIIQTTRFQNPASCPRMGHSRRL